jgi:hypothetical protein
MLEKATQALGCITRQCACAAARAQQQQRPTPPPPKNNILLNP